MYQKTYLQNRSHCAYVNILITLLLAKVCKFGSYTRQNKDSLFKWNILSVLHDDKIKNETYFTYFCLVYLLQLVRTKGTNQSTKCTIGSLKKRKKNKNHTYHLEIVVSRCVIYYMYLQVTYTLDKDNDARAERKIVPVRKKANLSQLNASRHRKNERRIQWK